MTMRERWSSMISRCENPSDRNYDLYGARGITVCERWHDYATYAGDIDRLLGPCPDGMTLDRIDNDGGYEPGNVRWATWSQQNLNRRPYSRWRVRPRATEARWIRARETGQRIRDLLIRVDWSPADLARHARISPATLSRILSGERAPRPETLRRIGEALGTRQLLAGDGKKAAP